MDITEICAEICNYFLPNRQNDIYRGHFKISGRDIAPLDFLQEGQYFRIVGSTMNDGVYHNTPESKHRLKSEEFDGAVWAMSVPPAFVMLCHEIETWRNKHESIDSQNMSPYTSESFGGYSYSKGSSNSSDGRSITWQDQFKERLNVYRRLRIL